LFLWAWSGGDKDVPLAKRNQWPENRLLDESPNGLAPLPFNFIDLVETRHPDLIWIKGH
jgi:hypothetical protein